MNATMSLRLDKSLKESFSDYAKDRWVEPSMLLRKFMSWCLQREEAVKIDIDEKLFDDLVGSEKSINRLKVLAQKVKTIR